MSAIWARSDRAHGERDQIAITISSVLSDKSSFSYKKNVRFIKDIKDIILILLFGANFRMGYLKSQYKDTYSKSKWARSDRDHDQVVDGA